MYNHCRRLLRFLFPTVLLAASSTRAAFELDDLESTLPFAGHRGLSGNPAELTLASCPSWKLEHHLQFGLRQLSHHSLGLALPLKTLHLGAGLGSTGFALHRELSAWLGGGLPLGGGLAAGASIAVLHLRQETLMRHDRTLSLGLGLELGNNLQLSAWWRGNSDLAPPRFFFKLVHRPDAQSVVYAHVRQQPHRPRRLDLAAEHGLHPQLRLRLGTRSTPRRFALGTSVETGQWTIEYAVKTHARLGPSHTFGAGNTCRSP